MGILLYTEIGAICGTFLSGTTLCGAAGDQYELPDTLVIEGDDSDERWKEEERAWQHGSVLYGEEVEPRDILVSGLVSATTATAMQTLVREMREAARRSDQRLRYDEDFYVNVSRLRRMDVRWEPETGKTLAQVRLVWRAADPFWYATSEASQTENPTGDDTLTVDTGTDVTIPMNPVITITAPPAAAVPSVRLTNQTDDDQAFLYEDLDLENGASVTIDCEAGTVTRGATNTLRYLTGGWLRLLPGSNTIAYEGDACEITLTWKPRWI